ncbi:Vacuolar (H+)-ATPase G subunit [Dillenia turbinata]|uniref:V-type proton ATPase subunit G n=1 Tax=Dillenia turbinata TaxID=194707 RepID=A0AAN8V993_9MAGN
MASSRGQTGIQLLLAAEQEAQKIVNAARNEKFARLKQAKEEADKEIVEFRAQMEREFQRKVEESSGDSGANVKRLERETEVEIVLGGNNMYAFSTHSKVIAAVIASGKVVETRRDGATTVVVAVKLFLFLSHHFLIPEGSLDFSSDPGQSCL